MNGRLFVISGPSGVGKTTLVGAAIAMLQHQYPLAQGLTYTTRAPRSNENHGKDYFFISQADFEAKIGQGFFLEWSDVYGAYYGSSRDILTECAQGNSRILILNWEGAVEIAVQVPQAVLIWITISDINLLRHRLQGRGADSDQEIVHRLNLATREIERENEEKRFKYRVLNDDFEAGYMQLTTILSHEMKGKGIAVLQE